MASPLLPLDYSQGSRGATLSGNLSGGRTLGAMVILQIERLVRADLRTAEWELPNGG